MNQEFKNKKQRGRESCRKGPGLPKRIRHAMLRKLAAACLIGLLVLSPCMPLVQDTGQVQAAELIINILVKQNILSDIKFEFFQEPIGSGIYYWIKQGGGPLFCIQQHKPQLIGGAASESTEEFEDGSHFTREQYELVSIVLQCCSQKQKENGELAAGEYLAGQAAIWGIMSPYWTGADQLRTEMERLHQHVRPWNEMEVKELVGQSETMTEIICQSIQDYYADSSRYIPAFASKYPDRAPVWQAQWQDDGSCQAVFRLEDRSESVKDFAFQLPDGWSCAWEEDQVVFTCEEPKTGTISVTGRAPGDSALGAAMPVGLIRLITPKGSRYQHMVSGVEITVPWSCYFKLFVPEPPEETGSWRLPEVFYYRHREDFSSVYGVRLQKTDGDSKEPLAGVGFQALEYFDAGQLEGTVLDRSQIKTWSGWRARCGEDVTDEEGRLSHWDRKEYHYEKTYCGGHPEPVIEYEGRSEKKRQQLEEEAWEAWEAAVEDCRGRCDYHTVDGTGGQLLEADRDLAYEQFTHLIYGYTFQETKGAEGYLPHGESPKDKAIEAIFCTSLQAGAETFEKERLPQQSERSIDRVRASSSDAGKLEGSDGAGRPDGSSDAERPEESGDAGRQEGSGDAGETDGNDGEKRSGSSTAGECGRTASASDAAETHGTWSPPRNIVWLTSLVAPLEEEALDMEVISLYLFQVENHKPETPVPSHPGGGGKDRNPPPPADPEPLPPEMPPPKEPAARVGWIQARYEREPVSDDGRIRISRNAGYRTGGLKEDGLFPKTGENRPGMGGLVIIMLLAGGGAFGLFRKRAEEIRGIGNSGAEEKSRKYSRCLIPGLLPIMLAAAGNLETRAEEKTAPPEILLTIPMEIQTSELNPDIKREEPGMDAPDTIYVDEAGRTYVLEHYQQVEHILPEREEAVSTTGFYSNLEDISQIPQQIPYEAEEEGNGRVGTGRLEQKDIRQTFQQWSDDFSVPLTFYDYGAEQYVFQDAAVPGGMELQYFLDHPDFLLAQIGCGRENYEILEINWDGEAYLEQGLPCRNALASGRKLVADYQVEYSGTIRYPEITVPEWEALYRLEEAEEPKMQEETTVVLETSEPERDSDPAEELPVSQQDSQEHRWKVIRTVAACTVSMAVLLPLLLYLAAWMRKKKKDSGL